LFRYNSCHDKILEQAMARVRELPAEDRDALAAALLPSPEIPLRPCIPTNARAAMEEGLAQATSRGEFVHEEVAEAIPGVDRGRHAKTAAKTARFGQFSLNVWQILN
jgi:hypothetical protein